MTSAENTLYVPALTNSDFGLGRIPWTMIRNIAQRVDERKPFELIDLSGAIHLKPFVLAMIVALCRLLPSDNLDIEWPEDASTCDHLGRLHLPDILGVEGPTSERRETNVPLEVLKQRPSEAFSDELTAVLEREFSCGFRPGMRHDISNSIDEIILNALTHSDSAFGCVVVGQAFPGSHYVEAAIVDLGITILGHLIRKFPKLSVSENLPSDQEAVLMAVQEGVTGTIDLNRFDEPNSGVGLSETKDFIERVGGEMAILSGAAVVSFGDNPCTQHLYGPRFPGTLVNLKFCTG